MGWYLQSPNESFRLIQSGLVSHEKVPGTG